MKEDLVNEQSGIDRTILPKSNKITVSTADDCTIFLHFKKDYYHSSKTFIKEMSFCSMLFVLQTMVGFKTLVKPSVTKLKQY